MENDFDKQGLEILRQFLPNCHFEKNNKVLLVKRGNQRLECKVDFEMLFNLIYDDLLLRQRDSKEWYWQQLGEQIESTLNSSYHGNEFV